MEIKKVIFIFALIVISFFTAFSDDRGLNVIVKTLDGSFQTGKQYLVLIGIDRYQSWPGLQNPVKDAKEIRDILKSRYYIDTILELYDEQATKSNILKLLDELQQKLTVNDSLLLIYTGHGHLDKKTNTGFWIPVNAGLDVYEQANWLPNTQVRGLVSNIKATHLCIIADACFSGDILNTNRAILPKIDNDYFKTAYRLTSRQVLTSGASETVPDESEFARQLKMVLMKNSKPFLDPLMLYNDIRLGVSATLPLLGNLRETGHQEGASFILFLKDDPSKTIKNYGIVQVNLLTAGTLFLDSELYKEIGAGNTTIEKVEEGEHLLKMEYPDGKTEENKVKVEKDKTVNVSFTWVKEIFGTLKVDVKTGGSLFIDDTFYGKINAGETEIKDVKVGTHTIRIIYETGIKEEKKAEIKKDEPISIIFTWTKDIKAKEERTWFFIIGAEEDFGLPFFDPADARSFMLDINFDVGALFAFSWGKLLFEFDISIQLLTYWNLTVVNDYFLSGTLQIAPITFKANYIVDLNRWFYITMGMDAGLVRIRRYYNYNETTTWTFTGTLEAGGGMKFLDSHILAESQLFFNTIPWIEELGHGYYTYGITVAVKFQI